MGAAAPHRSGWLVSQDGSRPGAQTGAGREDAQPLQRDSRQQGSTLTKPSDGARCRRCGSPGSAGRPTLTGAGSGTCPCHWTLETPRSSASSNCSVDGATHEHAQVGRDARRHGKHRGVDPGPCGGRSGVPVLRPAGRSVQAAERGHARHPQAVVVVPAVRDHLGGLTLHRLQDGLRRAAPWSLDRPGFAGGVPGWLHELLGGAGQDRGTGSAEEPGAIQELAREVIRCTRHGSRTTSFDGNRGGRIAVRLPRQVQARGRRCRERRSPTSIQE
jgi:hypothetical protein